MQLASLHTYSKGVHNPFKEASRMPPSLRRVKPCNLWVKPHSLPPLHLLHPQWSHLCTSDKLISEPSLSLSLFLFSLTCTHIQLRRMQGSQGRTWASQVSYQALVTERKTRKDGCLPFQTYFSNQAERERETGIEREKTKRKLLQEVMYGCNIMGGWLLLPLYNTQGAQREEVEEDLRVCGECAWECVRCHETFQLSYSLPSLNLSNWKWWEVGALVSVGSDGSCVPWGLLLRFPKTAILDFFFLLISISWFYP